MARIYRLTFLIAVALLTGTTYAQLPVATAPNPPATPAKPAEQDPLGRDSPRGCVMGFLKAAERGDYTEAAQYLDTRMPPQQAQELAQQLQVVLNHGLSGNLDGLSRAPEGDLKDGLRDNRDQAGFHKNEFRTSAHICGPDPARYRGCHLAFLVRDSAPGP